MTKYEDREFEDGQSVDIRKQLVEGRDNSTRSSILRAVNLFGFVNLVTGDAMGN